MTLVPRSWLRLGRREIPVPIFTDFRFKFPTAANRDEYLQHIRGADVANTANDRTFLRLPDLETVIFILDYSGSMADPTVTNIDPPPSTVLEQTILNNVIPQLTAQGRQGLLVEMPGQPVVTAGESWLHLLGRIGEFVEFNNFIAGDILFMTFSNGAEFLSGEPEVYYFLTTTADPYPGPTDTFWEHYSWLAPDYGGGSGSFIPSHNAQNYRSLGAISYNCPRFSATGGPPYTYNAPYNEHLFQAYTGTGFHVGFPLNRPEISQLMFFGGELDHNVDASVLLAAIDNHFAQI